MSFRRWFFATLFLAVAVLPAHATTRQQEICARRTCSTTATTCPSATACQHSLADRVRSVCGLALPNTLCLTNEDTTCLQNDACLSQNVGSATTPSASNALCCRCQKAGKRVCVQNISDAGAAANCGDILRQSATLRGLASSNAALFNGFSCENAALNASQCRTVAQSGTCGGDGFANPPLTEAGGLVAALSSATGTNAATTTAVQTGREFRSITPALGVPFPQTSLSPASLEGGFVSIPFLAQYIEAGYRYGISVSIIAAIIMMIYGGFRYLVGSALEDVSRGKQIVTDAIAGLMIVLGAYLILSNVNPATIQLRTIKLQNVTPESYDDAAANNADPGSPSHAANAPTGRGPTSLCRENLPNCPSSARNWCAACGGFFPPSLHVLSGRDQSCWDLAGPLESPMPCGREYGIFLRGLTFNEDFGGLCTTKRFDSLESLDGLTFGILHYTADNLPGLLQEFRREDANAYQTIFGSVGTPLTSQGICQLQRDSRGAGCHPGLMRALRQALVHPSFTRVQIKNSYQKMQSRLRLAARFGFQSAYGQLTYAIATNNPGSCGCRDCLPFTNVRNACQTAFAGSDEQAKITCFLDKYVELGCRGGVASAGRRRAVIIRMLGSLSRSAPPAPPSVNQVINCVASLRSQPPR